MSNGKLDKQIRLQQRECASVHLRDELERQKIQKKYDHVKNMATILWKATWKARNRIGVPTALHKKRESDAFWILNTALAEIGNLKK